MLYERPWGFDLKRIDYPIQVYQSGRDLNVPPDMGHYLANRLPAAHLEDRLLEVQSSSRYCCYLVLTHVSSSIILVTNRNNSIIK